MDVSVELQDPYALVAVKKKSVCWCSSDKFSTVINKCLEGCKVHGECMWKLLTPKRRTASRCLIYLRLNVPDYVSL
jgi:hypothetical protein